MASVFLSVEGVSSRRRSGKPRLLLRGMRRKMAKKALNALIHLNNQEFAEARRSTEQGYNGYYILGASNSRFATAAATLKARLEEVLAAKA